MNAQAEQLLIEKIKALPPEDRAEVEDFIDFLRTRYTDRRIHDAAARASEPTFKAIWDNDQDAGYDKL